MEIFFLPGGEKKGGMFMQKIISKDALNYGIEFSQVEMELIKSVFSLRKYNNVYKNLYQGGELTHISLITSGVVRVYTNIASKQSTIGYFKAGSWIGLNRLIEINSGENFLFDPIQRVEMVTISAEDLKMLLSEIQSFEKYLRSILLRQYFDLLMEKNRVLQFSPEELYTDFVENFPEIISQVPLKQVANYLNIQPGSLSRIRKRLNNK